MSKILELREKAKKIKQRIILPEGDDARVVKAAAFIAREKIAEVSLLGKKGEVEKLAKENNISLDNVRVIDPAASKERQDLINTYYELRKAKGISLEAAEKTVIEKKIHCAALMTRMNLADGFVAGASNTTADVARAAIQCLRPAEGIDTVSSAFIIELEKSSFGENGLFVYADCAIIPFPSAKQLAGIALGASELFQRLFDKEPIVALLSYSTKGSASSPSIDAIREALAKIKEKRPDLKVDGELQADAAIVPEVARIKCPDSKVAGKANVLIFPTLDAGNISYKLTQRLGNARAVGPLLQGLDRPCSDLSRGCSWEDVVDTVAVTAIRARGL